MADLLHVSLWFPRGYAGNDRGTPEEVPSPTRLCDAMTAAAGEGPWAESDGRALRPCERHRTALRWLEEHEPVALSMPQVRLSQPEHTRYRWRASPVTLTATAFEGLACFDGTVTYHWPAAPSVVVEALREIAAEVTHVGRIESSVLVRIEAGPRDSHDPRRFLPVAPGRGAGRVLRVPVTGRLAVLEDAHQRAIAPGPHRAGSMGPQASDVHTTGGLVAGTTTLRFAEPRNDAAWPYREVLLLAIRRADRDAPEQLRHPSFRPVAAAVGLHRAIVRAIGEDVPSFVTGRDGAGPSRGLGHLAIQFRRHGGHVQVALALPPDVAAADRERLISLFDQPFAARLPTAGRVHLQGPRIVSAVQFWKTAAASYTTTVPMVLDTPGVPKHQPWTLDDAVTCSVGYALRRILAPRLEDEYDLPWASGWSFRRRLVALLREELGVRVAARRIHRDPSPYVHRAREGDLLVAAHATVDFGRLTPGGGAFVALGRARHLGGGLLVPETESLV